MEKLLVSIGEFVATELDDVLDIQYVDKAMGYMFYINMADGKRILLSLVDSKLDK